MATVNLGCKINLQKIALKVDNVKYNPKKCPQLIMRIRRPETTAMIYSSGIMTCLGATSEEDSKLAARRSARIIQKIGGFPDVKFVNNK